MGKIRDTVFIACLVLILLFGITTSADTLETKTKAESYKVVYCYKYFNDAGAMTEFLNKKQIEKENIIYIGMDAEDSCMSIKVYTLIYKK